MYGSYVESSFTTQNTKHKGAHNHGITMTKCGKFIINQNSAGMIGVLGVYGFSGVTPAEIAGVGALAGVFFF